jgi:hypothetical protein
MDQGIVGYSRPEQARHQLLGPAPLAIRDLATEASMQKMLRDKAECSKPFPGLNRMYEGGEFVRTRIFSAKDPNIPGRKRGAENPLPHLVTLVPARRGTGSDPAECFPELLGMPFKLAGKSPPVTQNLEKKTGLTFEFGLLALALPAFQKPDPRVDDQKRDEGQNGPEQRGQQRSGIGLPPASFHQPVQPTKTGGNRLIAPRR